MKILIKSEDQNIRLILPTNLILSEPIAWIADRACTSIPEAVSEGLPPQAAEAVAKIPPGAVRKLFAELRRIKKKSGSWDLVEVRSASGDLVQIRL